MNQLEDKGITMIYHKKIEPDTILTWYSLSSQMESTSLNMLKNFL